MILFNFYIRFAFAAACFLVLTTCANSESGTNLQAGLSANLNRRVLAKNHAPTDKTVERIATLQNVADRLLTLFDNMPVVPVFVKDAPILKKGTNVQTSVAFTDCQNKSAPTIYIKRIFYAKANQQQLTNILKHELTHAFFCRQGIPAAHDERFRRKFKQVGGFGN